MTTAITNPMIVVIKVCHALSRIGQRHCQPEAKNADGDGNTNCSMWKAAPRFPKQEQADDHHPGQHQLQRFAPLPERFACRRRHVLDGAGP